MKDFKQLIAENYLHYASYVILERAIPDILDGLKPVQRRILYTFFLMHDGKMHKVANVSGQTMALHPHGDAPINDALIQLANKGYLLETQGNFGNIYTGDPAAAARYIEARLSPLALEVLFNPDLTEFIPSYDGRKKEPLALPAKIPLLLMQGVDGIAVGMSTHILPHNFVEVLEGEIAYLEGKDFTLLPDFPTGGMMDAEEYLDGKGKIKLRAKIEILDPKTLIIKEICYGTTTESLIHSIDEAAKKGRIKIDSIDDYTAGKVDIQIKLPRGQYANDVIKALYAYTECEVTLHSDILVIKDDLPWSATVKEIIQFHAKKLQEYIKKELEIEKDHLLEKILEKTLEQIFIENRLYKKIEEVKSYEKIHETIEKSLKPFHSKLIRVPTHEDRERLLSIPIRRISRFDIEKNQEEIVALEEKLDIVEKKLKNIKKEAIHYLKGLIQKFGKTKVRKTKITEIEQIDKREIAKENVKISFDPKTGFLGTKVSSSENSISCTNFDKILLFFQNGTYKVISVPEKKYILESGSTLSYMGVADKTTVINLVTKDPKSKLCFGKRFIVTKFILDKEYRFFEEKQELVFFSTKKDPVVELQFIPKPKQKISKVRVAFNEISVKGVSAKGIRLSSREVKKVLICHD